MKSRFLAFIVSAAALLLAAGVGCGRKLHAPIVDSVAVTPYGPLLDSARLTVQAHDPDGDSVRLRVRWGSDDDAVTDFYPSPCCAVLNHLYSRGPGSAVIVEALDMNNISIPETTTIPVEPYGTVKWFWWDNNEDQGALTTSPLIVNVGPDELVAAGCKDDYKFYTINLTRGRTEHTATTKWPEWVFTGHPGFCAATQHVIVGSDEGELYALEIDSLTRAWMWPNKPAEESLSYIEWGAPAFYGDKIYISHDDDSLFLFQDAGSQGNRLAAYGCNAAVIDAPAVDAAGNVYFGTDSGYLVKMDAGIVSPIWRSHLVANGEIHGPIIGTDGTIYCTSDLSHVYAIDPTTGVPRWITTVNGEAFRPVLGQTALFVAGSYGLVYSIDPETGGINWANLLSPYDGFSTAPVVAANGYVYFRSDADVLYCLNQADGTLIWTCDCPSYLPRTGGGNPQRPRKAGVADYPPNPTIASNGDILVAGYDALYCVAGYPEGPLDPLAPWPKWQHDLYNTGYVGGVR